MITAVLALLFFAITNYINLTVANTGFRSKEMATRRLFGSSQRMIAWKLIAESTLMVALAFAIGFTASGVTTPTANALAKEGKIAFLSDNKAMSKSIEKQLKEEASVLPAKVDLRDYDKDGDGKGENYVTPVKFQNPFGTCWAFGIQSAAEISYLFENNLGTPAGTKKAKYVEKATIKRVVSTLLSFP